MNSLPQKISQINKIRITIELLNHLLKITASVFLWFLIFSLFDNILHLNIFLRWLNFIVLTLFILFHLLKKLYARIKLLTAENLVISIENKYNFKDQLISAYQLYNESNDNYFIKNLLNNAEILIKKIKITEIIDFKNFYFNILKFLIILSFLLGYHYIFPQNFYVSFNRFVNPEFKIKHFHKIAKVEIYPQGAIILEGENLNILLKAYGKVSSPKVVFINPASGNIIKINPLSSSISNINETNKIYVYSFLKENIYDNFKYYGETIQTRDNIPIKTKEYLIKVVKAPYIKKLKFIYLYPSYTGLKPKVVEDNGNIEAVEKSTIKIKGEANNQLKDGEIIFKSGKKNKLKIYDNKFEGDIFVNKDDEYSIKIVDIYQNTNHNSPKYQIIAIKDNLPNIEIVKPGIDIELKNSLLVPLEILAQDDYAINEVLLYYKVYRKYIKIESKFEKIEFKTEKLPEIKINYEWDLNKLSLSPGDYVEYYATAWDGYNPKESHTSSSKKYLIKFPTMEEMYRNLNKEQSENIISLQQLLETQEKMAKETEDFIKSLETKRELSYVEQKEIERLKTEQEIISQNIKKISEKLAESIEKIKKDNLFTPQIIEKSQQIKELMDEIINKDVKEALKKLQEALEKINISETKRQMLSAKLTQEEILKRLDKTLEMLKKLKAEQQLESIKKMTDEIIKKQQELLQNTIDTKFKNKYDPSKLAENQSQIRQDFNNLKEELNNFLNAIKNDSPQIYKQMNEILKQLENENLENEMINSENSLKSAKYDNSINSQRKIISGLNNLKNFCDSACSGMQQLDLTKIIDAIDNAIFNFLKISEELEISKNKLEILTAQYEKYIFEEKQTDFDKSFKTSELSEKMIFIERALRYHTKILENETKSSLIFSQAFFKQFDNLFNSVSQTRDLLSQNKTASAIGFNKNSLLYLNSIIKQLLDLKESLKESAQNQASGAMSDALNQLANSQQKLNELTERLKGQIGQQGMSPELQEYLEELAFQQELIRKSVNQFLENYKEAGQLLGDLAKASQEMNEIKEKLKSGKIDSELIKKQNEVLKRLLDSQKSLYVKEYSKERKAETAKEYKPEKPPELPLESLKSKEEKYYYQLNEKYPLDYKKLVDEYFKILSIYETEIYKIEK